MNTAGLSRGTCERGRFADELRAEPGGGRHAADMDTEARVSPPLQVGERKSVTAFLDVQRVTMLRKVAGLSKDQLGRIGVPTSALTLPGLVKHLALVEDAWFQEVFLGRPLPEPWAGVPWEQDDD